MAPAATKKRTTFRERGQKRAVSTARDGKNGRRLTRRQLLGHFDDQLAGDLVSGFDRGAAGVDLALIVVAAGLGAGQAGQFQRKRQEIHKPARFLLLAIDILLRTIEAFGIHGSIPYARGGWSLRNPLSLGTTFGVG